MCPNDNSKDGGSASIGRLAGGIAHDLTNLLATIQGCTDLLLLQHEAAGDSERANLEEIRNACERAGVLTRRLFAHSRRQELGETGAGSNADGSQGPPESLSPGGGEQILIVEDDDAVRAVLGRVLRRQGYRLLEASCPAEAFDLFNAHVAEIDLLLSDVVMPELNGPALAQRLIAQRPDLRVLFISGYSDVLVPIEPNNPNLSFLGKPFRAAELLAKVRDVLSRPPL